MIKQRFFSIALVLLALTNKSQTHKDTTRINSYFRKAFKCELYSWQRQAYMDSILALDHTNAYAWQQKGMPLLKQKKYELAMPYNDSAVKYDAGYKWLEYRAYCKCIFQKSYRSALADFMNAEKRNPGGIVMDHSYDFFSGLCYLQLNKPDSAIFYIQRSIAPFVKRVGLAHPLESFYLGIAYMESRNYLQAIKQFDASLQAYGRFSDANYYKGKCLRYLGKNEDATSCFTKALADHRQGYTINEDNVIYEDHPYQVKDYWLVNALKK